ncbi:MAG: asparagine synthase (glutamine-hydrolyzing) [Pseudomonadota bacterium]|nr:asparagine synthase (glutamine-hydrolyzing) [Pseudomonadota bacterium]
MCGIAGIVYGGGRTGSNELRAIADDMAASLAHRGPDASGIWVDDEAQIAFAHTRLSIIDLSEAGAQPMHSSCGRLVLSYNGEVYNANELRRELEAAGRGFRGHSDTEVIVEGCAEWGVEATVKRLIGMFAFSLWDKKTKTLTLARDRLGIKPLYWGIVGGRFLFGSELKALAVVPDWTREVDRQSLAAFLRLSYVPAPYSIYKGISKLEPGKLLEFRPCGQPEIRSFWSLGEVVQEGLADPLDIDDGEALERLETLLRDAVRRRLVSDVPLGAFLSGGIDSSTVVALMQQESTGPVRSFSIGFREEAYNEADQARAVAAHLGTEHVEQIITPQEARDVIPHLPRMYDEPFADSSQIPTFLVSRMTRQHVTVALSGDGGDELFAGYNRYGQAAMLHRYGSVLPLSLRRAAASGITALPPSAWDRLFGLIPASRRPRLAGDKMHKLAGVLGEDAMGFYRKLTSQWDEAASIVPGASERDSVASDRAMKSRFTDDVAWMQFVDTATYLPDDILTKVDRASMAVALEARVPILDHRMVEFAWRLPMRFKMRNGQSKWLLRQVLGKYVPKELFERPKMGFGVPIDAWLRGPLKDWAADLLDASTLRDGGLIDPDPITKKWIEHSSGQRNWQYFLWNVLMFQAWRFENRL